MARGAERLLGVGSQPSAHELGHGGLAQRAGMHRDRHGIVGYLGEQPGVGRLLGRARGRRDEYVQAFQPALEVRDETQRRLVTPMQVVDQQQQRSVGGDVRRDPEQAVENAEGDVGLGVAVIGRLEHPCRRLRGAGHPPRTVGGIDQEGIEQLPHDAERQFALEVAPTGGKHAETGALRRFTSRGEQSALPDPGRSLDQCQARPALERALNQILENTELAVALEQLVGRRLGSLASGIDRHRRACYRGSRSEISARISIDHLRRDLVHAVLLARMHYDLPEDLLVGLPLEGGPAPRDQHATPEFLHFEPPSLAGD